MGKPPSYSSRQRLTAVLPHASGMWREEKCSACPSVCLRFRLYTNTRLDVLPGSVSHTSAQLEAALQHLLHAFQVLSLIGGFYEMILALFRVIIFHTLVESLKCIQDF